MLNEDQLRLKQFVKNWFFSQDLYAVVNGRAGCGKTFSTLDVVREVTEHTLFTAPTNEAVKQLQIVVGKDHDLCTTYKALGFSFRSNGEIKELAQGESTIKLGNYGLIVVDEASMITEQILKSLRAERRKVLFLGHNNQLPPVVKNLTVFDKCISPVFAQRFPTYTLTTPVRNTGQIYEFCNHVESLIDAEKRILTVKDFNKDRKFLNNFIQSTEGRASYFDEETKFICWSNEVVDASNRAIRESIFGKTDLPRFLVGDKILLTEPYSFIGNITPKATLKQLLKMKGKEASLSTNSKAVVLKIEDTSILDVDCYKLKVLCEEIEVVLFVPKDLEQLTKLRVFLVNEAYTKYGKDRDKAFQNLHFIMELFASVKHSYAITTYRSQGATINRVQVNWNEMRRIPNPFLKFKTFYVASSRARETLEVIC